MLRFLVRLLVLAVLVGGLRTGESAPAPLPPVVGDLAGQLALPRLAGFPPLSWRVQFRPDAGDNLAFDASASAPGLEVQFELTLPRGETPGRWRIVSARIGAAQWWRLAADLGGVKSLPSDFEFTGELSLTGSGSWRGAEATGTLHAALAAGSARSALQNWTATGLVIESDLDLTAGHAALRSAHVQVETLLAAGVTAHRLLLEMVGADGGRLTVPRAEFAAFGGQVTFAPFSFDPAKPAITTTVDFPSVVLEDLVTLLPQALKEARGRIAGRVVVEWNPKDGLVSAEGSLATMGGETAVLRLSGSPGLLTSRMPARIALVPGVSFLSLKNPAIDTLRRVELGEDSLIVDRLKIELFSLKGAGARTAQVEIVGRPTDDRDVKHITLTVNVAGPLDQVLRLGSDKHSKLQMNPGK